MTDRFSSVLDVVLPREPQWALLRACLHEDESGRMAWKAWEAEHGGVTKVLAGGIDGVKRLLPMLHRAQRRNEIDVEPVVATCLRTAHMREEFRSNTYRSIANRALKTLREAGVDFIVLKGAALAETVYDEPGQRHCHDLDLLIPPEQMDRAVAALLDRESAEGAHDFRLFQRCGARGAERATVVHKTGLPVNLHQTLFRVPFYGPPIDAMRRRAIERDIAGVSSLVLAPADALLHVLGHAASSSVRRNAVWVCDAWLILEKNSEFDWPHFRATVIESKLALPIAALLSAMSEHLDVPVPDSILHDLRSHAAQSPVREIEAAIFAAASGPGGRIGDLRKHTTTGRERLALLKWMFLPSVRNTQAFYHIESGAMVPLFILARPIRGVVWRLFNKSWTAAPPEQRLPDFMAQATMGEEPPVSRVG